ncbi:saccharopine dehydrogenase NADP-binding domain-containing protein [bacterium]|nr:saccharopine dehydrogenase NADP-binding domain-containing protein [bacterium]MBU1071937.1 saccharopine dehydrogenase NADP-binding domain-containing protein [bacterium]MBU1674883.1 saccharopine dehydrogenase NADP-binding domain-containing protein [bacterium]
MKEVLVLGAGLVSRPLVVYLLEKGYRLTCASRTVSKAEALVAGHDNGTALQLDLKDEARLGELIAAADLAISLVPYEFHPLVARLCLEHGKHMVTTSYVSPQMRELDGAARGAGLTFLNEIGVDPGIDHMSAMRIIDDVRARGGKIVSFRSYCGGLPAPEDNDNPFGYKFSWAPRGVLMASRNGARYLSDGRIVEVPPERLFRDMHILQVEGFGDFEAYPNRDSLGYLDVYGLQGIRTLFRGTLRNMGWCDCLYNFRSAGLLELDELALGGRSYADVMRGHFGASGSGDLRAAAAARMGVPAESLPPRNLEWLGAFSDRQVAPGCKTMLDAMGDLMYDKLAFAKGERDMIVLYHDFTAEYAGGKRERTTSRLIDFGIENGDSSMSRTVSLPAAIGVHMILQGKITDRGVLVPVMPGIYEPVLDELATMSIKCVEETETYQSGGEN